MKPYKYSFAEISELCQGGVLPNLPTNMDRTKEVQNQYDLDRIRLEQITNTNDLFLEIINSSKEISRSRSEDGELEMVLIENKYPYYTEAKHWVLFVTKKELFNINAAKEFLKSLGVYDFVIWENTINHKSLPQLMHFQIFVK